MLLCDGMWSSRLPFRLDTTSYKFIGFGWLRLPVLHPSAHYTYLRRYTMGSDDERYHQHSQYPRHRSRRRSRSGERSPEPKRRPSPRSSRGSDRPPPQPRSREYRPRHTSRAPFTEFPPSDLSKPHRPMRSSIRYSSQGYSYAWSNKNPDQDFYRKYFTVTEGSKAFEVFDTVGIPSRRS